ncbi:uncharacterized protein K489DRAFT_378263 [Dissoconium aciculare CBS 342.82]|uniref:Uncharacterized protein n=1 Tax=Dissoconium aciculare CBS 342.82 TaxID=1314786 RepID=A0A6J3MFR3_9PEZI|nr:uncharacterized protein K489DRAFT_378263 [Dissoconium aciculare CBS 342.82]KAF1825722.1 hypothetical protein K489DRAFT_378263 [Dissoconium aciculare CBS 342.82]
MASHRSLPPSPSSHPKAKSRKTELWKANSMENSAIHGMFDATGSSRNILPRGSDGLAKRHQNPTCCVLTVPCAKLTGNDAMTIVFRSMRHAGPDERDRKNEMRGVFHHQPPKVMPNCMTVDAVRRSLSSCGMHPELEDCKNACIHREENCPSMTPLYCDG